SAATRPVRAAQARNSSTATGVLPEECRTGVLVSNDSRPLQRQLPHRLSKVPAGTTGWAPGSKVAPGATGAFAAEVRGSAGAVGAAAGWLGGAGWLAGLVRATCAGLTGGTGTAAGRAAGGDFFS